MRAQIIATDGQVLGVLVLDPKTFKTGSKGYFGQAKIEASGKHLQCQCQMVEYTPGAGKNKPAKK